ncbi:RidA family protein [Oceanobacillus jeddahense]|uniref:RidA family protein n=1 Tax=Oceanobacillus jeddahense TaxID=1462527 RepID=UPI000595A70F|nr:RidA family protein [Oceanobacillus jeddahense]
MNVISKKIESIGISLPEAPPTAAKYLPAVTVNNLVYTSGNDCRVDGQLMFKGKVGKDLTKEEGKLAARQTMLNLLSTLEKHLGSLDKIDRVVKILGFVNSAEDFKEQPYVLDGASEILEDIFDEKGWSARSAIGTSELPFGTPVEIEMIVKIK